MVLKAARTPQNTLKGFQESPKAAQKATFSNEALGRTEKYIRIEVLRDLLIKFFFKVGVGGWVTPNQRVEALQLEGLKEDTPRKTTQPNAK